MSGHALDSLVEVRVDEAIAPTSSISCNVR
jgi:hypothetical protein